MALHAVEQSAYLKVPVVGSKVVTAATRRVAEATELESANGRKMMDEAFFFKSTWCISRGGHAIAEDRQLSAMKTYQ